MKKLSKTHMKNQRKEPLLDFYVEMIDGNLPSVHIGVGVVIQGDLSVPGEIVINGTYEGVLKAINLIVGEAGIVRGYVEAKYVHIYGKTDQTVMAVNHIHIYSTANVMGEIVYGDIQVEKGAEIEGVLKRRKITNDAHSGAWKRILNY